MSERTHFSWISNTIKPSTYSTTVLHPSEEAFFSSYQLERLKWFWLRWDCMKMFSNLQTQTRNCRCTNNCFRFWILSSLKYWIADDGLPIWVSKLLHIPMHLVWQFNPSVTEDWKEKEIFEGCESNLDSPGRRFVSKMLCQLFQEVF